MAAHVLTAGLSQRHDISVFLDTERVVSAALFPDELERAIESCDIFLCLLARKTLASAWVNQEIRLALKLNKRIIPVFQEGFLMPKSPKVPSEYSETLRNREAVYLLDQKGIYIDAAIEKLARMIIDSVRTKDKRRT
jgi:hypothetical protein